VTGRDRGRSATSGEGRGADQRATLATTDAVHDEPDNGAQFTVW